ncbi:MAG: ATP-dependent DNA ligase [Myxococcota bacterium]|nr:ATP-dependent DNA ligase [Myxococcota bacterium]
MRLADLVETSRAVASASGRLAKVERLAALLSRARVGEVEPAVAFLVGELPLRLGVGPAKLREVRSVRPAAQPSLSVGDVVRAFADVAGVSGRGSGAERLRLLSDLLGRATGEEQTFLVRLMIGELRQGALEGVMVDAVARAADLPRDEVRRALMLEGDLPRVARIAFSEGRAGLARLDVELFRPLKPMLASPAEDVDEVLERLGEAAFEHKLDGARVQVHKSGGEVRAYTRRLHDVTPAVPEIVEALREVPARELVLDGETLALRPDGRPFPFQTTMRRFGRKLDVARMREELPLRVFFFDCLRRDGQSLVDRPGRERAEALADALPGELRIARHVSGDRERAEACLREALAAGHEGLVAKSLDAPYAAGSRGREWLKLKAAHTLDLVVLAAEWGHGRRQGWLSNLHLGARDPASGRYVMLGKTFKGLTDEMLAWQTQRLQEIAVERDAFQVTVEPRVVVEVAFAEVQTSPRYPAGLALRLARVKRYRPDKAPEQADTLDAVRALGPDPTSAPAPGCREGA